jgi:hypothetical protein
MDGLLPVVVMENILVVDACPTHHCRPLLPHPPPLPNLEEYDVFVSTR